MVEIRILTPEELEARTQKRSREGRSRHRRSETRTRSSEEYTSALRTNQRPAASKTMAASFEQRYPNIAYFVDAIGWIELGHDDDSPLTSLIRALDPGGMVWEGQDAYTTLDAAFQDLEQGPGEWMREEGIVAAE